MGLSLSPPATPEAKNTLLKPKSLEQRARMNVGYDLFNLFPITTSVQLERNKNLNCKAHFVLTHNKEIFSVYLYGLLKLNIKRNKIFTFIHIGRFFCSEGRREEMEKVVH